MDEPLYSGIDFVTLPFFVALIFFYARRVQSQNQEENPLYRYFTRGLITKVLAGFLVCLIYIFYYGGGDTIGYFESSRLMTRMLFINPEVYFSVLGGNLSIDNLNVYYTSDLCCPDYYKDPQSFAVVRFVSPLVLISGFNYFAATALMALVSYGGIWRLFLLFNSLFPGMEKKLATAILFMPSVMFWGSAILKDTITFSALCWLTVSVYYVFIKPERRMYHFLTLAVAVYLIISIKPYIFVAILPGATIWILFNRIKNISNPIIRLSVAPVIIILGLGVSSLLFSTFSESLGDYGSVDKALNKAVITKNDLTREAYGQNSFDIGEIDGSVSGLISKFPAAYMAGMFRPYLWDVTNPVMLMSALENSYLLLLIIRLLLRSGPGFFIRVFSNPVLIFCFVFTIFFAFALGLTTANFGALVRYKIPAIPFFLLIIFVLESGKDRAPAETATVEENSAETIAHEVVTT